MQVKYKLQPSTIKSIGMGIFADEFIPKDTLVWKNRKKDHIFYHSKQELKSKLETMSLEKAREYLTYIYPYNAKCVVYETDDGRYTNHNEVANLCGVQGDDRYAARDIEKGEELFENYIKGYMGECEVPWFTELEREYEVWQPSEKQTNSYSYFLLLILFVAILYLVWFLKYQRG